MFDKYEDFKKEVYVLTKIDLNYYKEKQMRRRIDAIATKNGCSNYEEYVKILKSDKEKFEQFVNFLTINVSEFYRNPDQWKLMDERNREEDLKYGVLPAQQVMNHIHLLWRFLNMYHLRIYRFLQQTLISR